MCRVPVNCVVSLSFCALSILVVFVSGGRAVDTWYCILMYNRVPQDDIFFLSGPVLQTVQLAVIDIRRSTAQPITTWLLKLCTVKSCTSSCTAYNTLVTGVNGDFRLTAGPVSSDRSTAEDRCTRRTNATTTVCNQNRTKTRKRSPTQHHPGDDVCAIVVGWCVFVCVCATFLGQLLHHHGKEGTQQTDRVRATVLIQLCCSICTSHLTTHEHDCCCPVISVLSLCTLMSW